MSYAKYSDYELFMWLASPLPSEILTLSLLVSIQVLAFITQPRPTLPSPLTVSVLNKTFTVLCELLYKQTVIPHCLAKPIGLFPYLILSPFSKGKKRFREVKETLSLKLGNDNSENLVFVLWTPKDLSLVTHFFWENDLCLNCPN